MKAIVDLVPGFLLRRENSVGVAKVKTADGMKPILLVVQQGEGLAIFAKGQLGPLLALPERTCEDSRGVECDLDDLVFIPAGIKQRAFKVTVTLGLSEGCTIEDAEIDSEDVLGSYEYDVLAYNSELAAEKALNLFHGSIAIGVLDFAEISTEVEEGGNKAKK